jgi:hypothetical protein
VSGQIIDGKPVGTATPGEILLAFDVADLAASVTGGSILAIVYATLRAVGVVRVDSGGEPFGIDLDMIAEQGVDRSGVMAVERRWHAGDYPGGRSVDNPGGVRVTAPGPTSGMTAWRALDTLCGEYPDEDDGQGMNAVEVLRDTLVDARELVAMIDRGEDYDGDSTILDRLRARVRGAR